MNKVTKAVIVAAGLSSRLYPLTLSKPKCILEIGRETIMGRSVRILHENGIKDILVIVGYKKEMIQQMLGANADYRFNPFFSTTNNMASLWFAKEWVQEVPFIYMHGDVVFAPELLGLMLKENREDAALLVEYGPVDKEAMKVRLNKGHFIESSKDISPREAIGEWVGIATFNQPHKLFNHIEALLEQGQLQAYDTQAFTQMAHEGASFKIIATGGYPWVEIDTEPDLERARSLFG
jgi:choline kinase